MIVVRVKFVVCIGFDVVRVEFVVCIGFVWFKVFVSVLVHCFILLPGWLFVF
jgi:hypothetical protein